MRMNFLRPREEKKEFHFSPEKVCKREETEWNVFSDTPKPGEKWGRYDFSKKKSEGK